MRKYIIGFIVGLMLASAGPAYGAVSSLVGKKVGSEIAVNLNGKEVGTAIIVDGRSYLPVRATTEALELGLEVSKEAINLVTSLPDISSVNNFDRIQELKGSIDSLNGARNNAIRKRDQLKEYLSKPDKFLQDAKNQLATFKDTTIPQYQKQLDTVAFHEQAVLDSKEELSELELMIIEYDRQIAELESQKSTLESSAVNQ